MYSSKLVLVLLTLVYRAATSQAKSVIVGGFAAWDPVVKDFQAWAAKNGPFYVGDSLVFYYDPPALHDGHNVFLLKDKFSFDNCILSGKVLAGYTQGYTPKGYALYLTQPGPIYLACSYPFHCKRGMKLAITVLPPKVHGPLSTRRAYRVGGYDGWSAKGSDYVAWGKAVLPLHTGDEIVFFYTSQYDVQLMRSASAALSCDFTGAHQVGNKYAGGRDSGFSFKFNKAGTYGFAASGNNCNYGQMKLVVVVF